MGTRTSATASVTDDTATSNWNYAGVLRTVAGVVPDRLAITCSGRHLTFGEFDRRTDAGYKVPKEIVVVGSLERGPDGKIDHRRMQELATTGAPEDSSDGAS